VPEFKGFKLVINLVIKVVFMLGVNLAAEGLGRG
jgi:hypothetical protein